MSGTVANQVAALTAIVQRMEHQLDNAVQSMAADRDKAELSRSAVSADLTDIRHSQTDVKRRLDKIEPVTDLVTSVRSRVTGGLILMGVLGGIAWAGLVFFKEVIVGWFQ
jgi:hypothetical protein